jgi:hypothetical protein
MARSQNLAAPPRQVSVERGGLGQSGYTAGRREGDTALEHAVDTRLIPPPGSGSDGLGTDDRFTGRGGPVGGDVERDSPAEIFAQPYPQANGAPDPDSSEPDGASGRWADHRNEDPR